MHFSFQVRSTSNEFAKLCGLRGLHWWVKRLRGSSGPCGFKKFWHVSKIL